VAIDIDIDDPTLANDVHSYVEAQLGETPFVRFGRQPRRVLLYRVDRLCAEHLLKGWSVGSTEAGKVELLGPGKQVVIFGTHPSSGKPYFWPQSSPMTAVIDAVPWTTVEQLEELQVAMEARLRPEATSVKSQAPAILAAPKIAGKTTTREHWTLDYLPEEGERADYLYWFAREKAAESQIESELEKALIAKNAAFSKPLTKAEIHTTARSVWKQKSEGRLMRSGKNAPAVLPVRRDKLAGCIADLTPNETKLYLALICTRDSREAFTIPQQATAVRLKMGKPTVVSAIKKLIAHNLIEVSGQRPNKQTRRRSATLYKFVTL
jgi:DNA-binding MarR family transcriptional regulator